MSINEENNTIVQLQNNKLINSSTSKEAETNDSTQNSVTGKNNYTKNCMRVGRLRLNLSVDHNP